MCGITGLYQFANTNKLLPLRDYVHQLCEQLSHRGPDARGIWESVGKNCVFGHTRLAIIDLDPRSNQPMVDRSKRYSLSFNGEIYNFTSLRQELESLGHQFHTHSDTEVLVEGYAAWQDGLFAKLDGMYALAIYDEQRNELKLARDRVGEKPLYYTFDKNTVAFSSELKPLLLLPFVDRSIEPNSLFEYLSLRYVQSPHTIISGIKCVQPGTLLKINKDGSWSEKSLFAFDIASDEERNSIDSGEFLEELDFVFRNSLKTRLISDVPLGAFLSKGVDSSLVCAIAAKCFSSKMKCFSAGFVDGEENETNAAKQIAAHLGLPYYEYLVSADDLLSTASNFGALLDEPNGDRSCVPTYFLSKLVKEQVTVAVSGDGGDELFGGYPRYAPLSPTEQFSSPFDAICNYFSTRLPVFNFAQLAELMPNQFSIFIKRFASRYATAFSRTDLHDLERLRLVDFHSYLPGAVLAKVDRMSMRNSLEVRTPFFSPDILRMSTHLPTSLSSDGRVYKLALRLLLSRYLPQEFIFPGKQGFGMPASFFKRYETIFNRLGQNADESLATLSVFSGHSRTYQSLRSMARQNINSFWAWIVLGQWQQSINAIPKLATR